MTTIHVRQAHIDRGEPNTASKCPIALALREAGYPGCQVSLGIANVILPPHWAPGRTAGIPLPRRAQDFARAFDSQVATTDLLLPFSFDIDIPTTWSHPT